MKFNIYDILFWIFFVIGVVYFLWYLFGDSPTFEQSLIILILGFILKFYGNYSGFSGYVKHSFIKVREDMDFIKTELKDINEVVK
ncbi:MAG: hypothetical protein ABIG37_00395 [Nanoarchaeota archaeon]